MRLLISILILFCLNLNSQTCSVSIATAPEHCGQICNGQAQAITTGQGPFTFLWQPSGQTTALATNLCPGAYTITVTDSLGCIAIDSAIIVTVPPLIVWISNVINPSCIGCADGCADGNASGGAPGYTYVWTPPLVVSMNYCGMSDSVIYTLCVTDANGCTVCADTSVNDPVGILEVPQDAEQIARVELFDLSGRLVWSGSYSAWLTPSRIELPPATYILIGSDESGKVIVRRTTKFCRDR